MKRDHIGIVTPGFSAAEDDWCIPVLLNLVRKLARDHNVTVYTLRYPPHNHTYQVYGATVRSFGATTVGGLQRLPLLGRAVRAIVHDAQRCPFSFLHGFWADEAGFVATVAARYLRIPAVVSLMGGELVGFPELNYGVQLSRSGRVLTRLSLRLAQALTCGSRSLQEIARAYLLRRQPYLLPLGVDTTLFKPPSPPNPGAYTRRRLLHVASLAPVKDQQTLLKAFAQVAPLFPTSELHIVGDGPLRSDLERLVQTYRIQEQVTFHGAVRHDQLPAHYQNADLFVLSSHYESQNLALLEAAACGLPAVGTNVGLLPDLLPESCLAPAGNAAALARAMRGLLADEPRRRRLARQLQDEVSTRYSLEETVNQLLALYTAQRPDQTH